MMVLINGVDASFEVEGDTFGLAYKADKPMHYLGDIVEIGGNKYKITHQDRIINNSIIKAKLCLQ